MSSSSIDQNDLQRTAARYERLLEVQSLMARVSREVGPALDLGQVLRSVLGAMRTLVDYDGAVISLLDGEELDPVAVDPPTDRSSPIRQHRRGLAGRALESGQSELVTDLRSHGDLAPELRATAEELGVASYLCVPLLCLGQGIGVIQVFSSRTATFDDEDRMLLEGLAAQVAGAIESARRYEMITQLEVLKSDFIARVSHELRTPITIMSGFVNTLLGNHERLDAETRGRMLERVDVATARLSGLIDELLMLSRLEAGVVAATNEAVDVVSLLEEVRRQAETPGSVEVDCAASLLLSTDPGLLVRALGFLVDNALKYAGTCRIVATDGVIEVVDDGPGIPAAQRDHVFERFTRANQDTTVAGMGIGLPMARTLLSAAGADLVLDVPETGTGTRMIIRFW